ENEVKRTRRVFHHKIGGNLDINKVNTYVIPNLVRNQIESYISNNLHNKNPYVEGSFYAEKLASFIWKLLSDYKAANQVEERNINSLLALFESISVGCNIPPILIKNCAREPVGSFIEPNEPRKYNYANDPKDRMKRHFHTEWSSWALALLLNHEN